MRHREGDLEGTPGRLRAALVAAPSSLLALLAIAVFLAWAASDAGYAATSWYPGALFLLAVLGVGVATLGIRWRERPRALRVAGVAFALFTAWSFLSLLWADNPGNAWDGANRTLLYLIAFLLFAAWAQRGQTATALLAVWSLGITVIALVELLRVANSGDALSFFVGGRLAEPAGYPNADAATWLMALWPALVLAARPLVPWWLRGLCAGAAVVLVDVSLLSQSRGSLVALGVTLVAAFVVGPARVRLLAVLVPVGIALAVTVPGVLDVEGRLPGAGSPQNVLSDAALPVVLAALVVAVVWGLIALAERMRPPSAETGRLVHRAAAAAGVVALAVGVIVALIALGDPAGRIDRAWASFKRGGSSPITTSKSSRLFEFGSNRYDFWRVSLDVVGDHPLTGVGVDNFGPRYLLARQSSETPRYPHSVEMSVLTGTGIVGALLFAAALVAGVVAAAGAVLRAPPLAATAAAGALLAFVYWFAHSSVDWLWEFPGLAAPALAFLGLAGALAPRATGDGGLGLDLPPLLGWIAGGVAVVAAALSFLFPWLSARDVSRAAAEWPRNPSGALARLDRAADLDPLSAQPALVAGSIALRVGAVERARVEFARALERDPDSSYAALELGAIASTQGRRAEAVSFLTKAAALNPRDPLTRAALARLQKGGRVSVTALNAELLEHARNLVH